MSDEQEVVVSERPTHGEPRPFHFPKFERTELSNGLGVITVNLPGRALVSASLVLPAGAVDEPPELGGVTSLMARALTEGTKRHDAIGLTEATERLGASMHAEAGWDGVSISVDVPAERLSQALELAAEVAMEPTFPAADVERMRDERLNDLLQAKADPRRRADDAYVETLYAKGTPYSRPSAGLEDTVAKLDADAARTMHGRLFDPAKMTLIVGGDLEAVGEDVKAIAESRFGAWSRNTSAIQPTHPKVVPARSERIVRVLHRPGSVQTEIRVGHVGLQRNIPDFHAVSVMSAILGGLFNSRLNRKLREEKGYTYGASAGFDLRRGPGPFAVRAAVNTDVTVPSVQEMLVELERMRDAPPESAELHAARDYLVGVFPLRFETPPAVVGAIAGVLIHGLPMDELDRYRPSIEAVSDLDVQGVATRHIRPEELAIVLVGDADAILPSLEAAALGPIVVEREDLPAEESAA
ncbi:MAG TPA: pitrilysin family protein [Candidatus Limnocylindrales bacterium]|nr:pitrilysin family protein [Candidatus Limnocylindrales bacterium]